MHFKCAKADFFGAIASSACAVHCVLNGIVFGILVPSSTLISDPKLELVFFVLAVLLGGWAAVRGFSKHHNLWLGMLFIAGLVMIGGKHFQSPGELAHAHSHAHSHSAGAWIWSAVGGLLLVVFHVLNSRWIHRATCDSANNLGARSAQSSPNSSR